MIKHRMEVASFETKWIPRQSLEITRNKEFAKKNKNKNQTKTKPK